MIRVGSPSRSDDSSAVAVVRVGSAVANHGKRSGRDDSSVAAVVRVGLAETNHPELRGNCHVGIIHRWQVWFEWIRQRRTILNSG